MIFAKSLYSFDSLSLSLVDKAERLSCFVHTRERWKRETGAHLGQASMDAISSHGEGERIAPWSKPVRFFHRFARSIGILVFILVVVLRLDSRFCLCSLIA